MKLAYVDLCGFRGYREPLRIEFAEGFTVIDGRNGAGKSTIFDAVEFGLTGTITKYGGATADRERVADYIWWKGEGSSPNERYVEVGFSDGDAVLPIRRSPFSEYDSTILDALMRRLCDAALMPKSPLRQLCATSIIRDEHIASLSLDMKETDRYALLCDAIGATDAEAWIERGAKLLSFTKKQLQAAQDQAEAAAGYVTAASRRIDELRAELVEEAIVSAAAARLQSFTGSALPPDQLAEPARIAIAERSRQLEELNSLQNAWSEVGEAEQEVLALRSAVTAAENAKVEADTTLLSTLEQHRLPEGTSGAVARQARDLDALVTLGRKLGLHEGHCPLCASNISHPDFERGLAVAEAQAKRLDERAVELAALERATIAAAEAAETAQRELNRQQDLLRAAEARIREFKQRLVAAGLNNDATREEISGRYNTLNGMINSAREDLRIINTLKLNDALARAVREESEAKDEHSRAEKKLGLARRADSRARALHDAARRATGETLSERLDRVMPLMSELYRRLRPHPLWGDIEYRIRGDVRRFLKLQVGGDLNPQFLFSSGQRRATGLAFLLSVNLSLAWSRWRTILLDDPVQHVDDFRSVQLSEVMAQLLTGGRQIICAVEDAALADLLCRRLPVTRYGAGKRVTLGPASDGSLSKLEERDLAPLPQHTLVSGRECLAG